MKEIKERFFSYINGDMDARDKQFFDHELKRDKIIDLIKENDLLGLKAQKKVRRLSITRRHFVVAAGILILILMALEVSVFFKDTSQSSNEKIFASYYSPYKAKVFLRSEKTDEINKLIDAITLYNKSNYKKTISELNELAAYNNIKMDVCFFSGLTFIELHDYVKAIKSLTVVIKQNDVFYAVYAEWYLALCYLKTNQNDHANTLLVKIANGNSIYKPVAMSILHRTN
jgi:tetratricopeptide (TPR) repeat protein